MAMSSVAHIRALIVRKESIKKSGIPSKNHLRLSRKGAGVCTDDVQCAKRQRLRLRVKQSLISLRATYKQFVTYPIPAEIQEFASRFHPASNSTGTSRQTGCGGVASRLQSFGQPAESAYRYFRQFRGSACDLVDGSGYADSSVFEDFTGPFRQVLLKSWRSPISRAGTCSQRLVIRVFRWSSRAGCVDCPG
jgi:hypothetical protein